METESLAWAKQFGYGCGAAVIGVSRAFLDPSLRQAVWTREARDRFAVSLVLVVVIHALVFPVEWVLSWIVPQTWLDITLGALRSGARTAIPLALVSICRYSTTSIFEKGFFHALESRNARMASKIKQWEAVYWDWEYFRHLVVFSVRQALFGLLALLISPILGVVIPFVRFGYRIRNMEMVLWTPIFVMFCWPWTRPAALNLVHLWVSAQALARELFDPVLARMKTTHRDKYARMRSHWRTSNSSAARFGFAMILAVLLQVPFFGPFAWFPAFIAAGLFAPELLELHIFGKALE